MKTNYNKKTRVLRTISLCAILSWGGVISCKNEIENNQEISIQQDSLAIQSLSTTSSTEGMIELAAQTPNPYTIQNMRDAITSLKGRPELNCDFSKFNVRVTHKYIKFKPQDSLQYGLLIKDFSLILFDYPMDRQIANGGTYYRDPLVPNGKPNFQWACVKVEKALPAGVPFDLLAELYLPEEDPNLVQFYDTDFDNCITLLIDEALARTGNSEPSDEFNTNGGQNSQQSSLRLPSKWTPAGTIKLSDNVLNTTTGLHGVKVRAHRWFETREGLTDVNGNFDVAHKFRYPVDYSIKWERNDYNIRSGRHGQAYFNGPHQRGNWNLDITGGVSWYYGQVHRGAHIYYYNNPTGLRTPPTNGFLGSRIAIGVLDEKGRANYKKRQRNWFGPEIFIYTSEDDGSGGSIIPNSYRIYETIIHELAHASHFNLNNSAYRNCKNMVKESWAIGVEWSFTKIKYLNAINYQDLKLQNGLGLKPYDVINWGERKYTPLVIDLIDNNNQRTNYGGNIDFPIDQVSGYTIRMIEDALITKTTMDAWRDQLKTTKPTGITNAQLDELFLNYTPLQEP